VPPNPAPVRAPAAGASVAGEAVVARASTYFRVTRYLMVLIFLGAGGWFLYDGFVKWPKEFDRYGKMVHQQLDIEINQLLGVTLPPVGIAFLVWAMYCSRGAYRLQSRYLRVPGHPPIPLDCIRKIDKAQWERKGIVRMEYLLPGTLKPRWIKMDDFVYERQPTDQILEQIETAVPQAVLAKAAS
jgi:hypothetical protein